MSDLIRANNTLKYVGRALNDPTFLETASVSEDDRLTINKMISEIKNTLLSQELDKDEESIRKAGYTTNSLPMDSIPVLALISSGMEFPKYQVTVLRYIRENPTDCFGRWVNCQGKVSDIQIVFGWKKDKAIEISEKHIFE